MGFHRSSRREGAFRTALIFLALAAIALRAIIPVGWMPGSSADGTAVVLCTSQGLIEVILGEDGKPIDPAERDEASHDGTPCVFAATAHFSAPPDRFEAAPTISHGEPVSFGELGQPPAGPAITPAQARAPPTYS